MGRALRNASTIFARMDRVAKQFSKIGKDIAIAVKAAARVPTAIHPCAACWQNARAVNMPKDRIEAAIKKASGQGATDYDIVLYEGYGPHGIAVIVETATDNVTRTVANVRHALQARRRQHGRDRQRAFMFSEQALFRLDPEGVDRDALELELIDHGLARARGCRGRQRRAASGHPHRVHRLRHDASRARRAQDPAAARPVRNTCRQTSRRTPRGKGDEVVELVATLESDDDVQNVYTNLA